MSWPQSAIASGSICHALTDPGLKHGSFDSDNKLQVNMSVALIPMANELGWSTTQRGLVSAAFFWGYAATQIPAGYIATRIGGAKVLLMGVMVWSVGAAVTSLSQQTWQLCAAMAILSTIHSLF